MGILSELINDPFCEGLVRTTLSLAVGFCLVEGFLNLFRITSARIQQFCWLAVLLLGWIWVRPSLGVTSAWSLEFFTASLADFANHKQISLAVLFVWATGVCVVLLQALRQYHQRCRVLSDTVEPTTDWKEQWEKITKFENLPKPVPMRMSFSVGPTLIRRWDGYELVVPMELWKVLEPRERVCLLRLQSAHLRNRNPWKFLLVRLLMLPHWFNPLAWLVLDRFDRAVEFAKDEQVYHETSDSPGLLQNALARWKESADVRFFSERMERLEMLQQDASFADTALQKAAVVGVLTLLFLALVVQVDSQETQTDSFIEPEITSERTMDETPYRSAVSR